MTRITLNRPQIKPLAERNRLAVGVVGILGRRRAWSIAAFSYDKIPFIKGTTDYSAYFAEAGGIKAGSDVRVSGLAVGRVSDVHLEGTKVLVDFTVRDGVELGDRTEAAIKTETVLGTKMLEVTPRGDGTLDGTIPLERTTSPYDLPSALGDLTTTISALDTTQLSSALTTLADTFKDTPPDLKIALEGVARFSDTLNTRDAQLRNLLANANKVTAVLAKRSDQIAGLVVNTNALLAELLSQREFGRRTDEQPDRRVAPDLRAGRRQPDATQAGPRQAQRRTAASWTTASRNCSARCICCGATPCRSARCSDPGRSSRPPLVNLAARPVRAAVHRLRVLRSRSGPQRAGCRLSSSTRRRRAAGHPGAARAVPAHRAGRRPESDAPRRHHRQPRRSGLRSARLAAARPDRLLPVPRTPASAAARWSAARSAHAARAIAGAATGLRPRARGGAAAVHRAAARPDGRRAVTVKSRRRGSRTAARCWSSSLPSRYRWWPPRGGTPSAGTRSCAYFTNTNGLYTGDEVRILGVAVGTIDEIDPQPNGTKVTFSVDTQYPVPADVEAAILSPSLVSARAMQLVPAYSSGPKLAPGTTIPHRPHGRSRRVGRLAPAAGEAHRLPATHHSGRGQRRSASSSTARRPTCAGRGHRPRHGHQTLASGFGTR